MFIQLLIMKNSSQNIEDNLQISVKGKFNPVIHLISEEELYQIDKSSDSWYFSACLFFAGISISSLYSLLSASSDSQGYSVYLAVGAASSLAAIILFIVFFRQRSNLKRIIRKIRNSECKLDNDEMKRETTLKSTGS